MCSLLPTFSTDPLHSTLSQPTSEPWLAQVPESTPAATEDGPIKLPPSTPSIFATSDDPTPLQVTTSVMLTGAISVFLFLSLRRCAKRAKELQFSSSGAKKSLKEEEVVGLGSEIGSEEIVCEEIVLISNYGALWIPVKWHPLIPAAIYSVFVEERIDFGGRGRRIGFGNNYRLSLLANQYVTTPTFSQIVFIFIYKDERVCGKDNSRKCFAQS